MTKPRPTKTSHRPPAEQRIIRYLGKSDAGEFGATCCPHCGADGRYVYTFECADGFRRGAMAGCLKLFPVSPVAKAHQRLLDKEAELAKKGWSPSSFDRRRAAAIEAFYAGETTEDACLLALRSVDADAKAYRAKRGLRY